MAVVRPFKGIRPKEDLIEKVASLPYDVMNREEAAKMAEGNPKSFLHVVRSEMDVPAEMSQYDEEVTKLLVRILITSLLKVHLFKTKKLNTTSTVKL